MVACFISVCNPHSNRHPDVGNRSDLQARNSRIMVYILLCLVRHKRICLNKDFQKITCIHTGRMAISQIRRDVRRTSSRMDCRVAGFSEYVYSRLGRDCNGKSMSLCFRLAIMDRADRFFFYMRRLCIGCWILGCGDG